MIQKNDDPGFSTINRNAVMLEPKEALLEWVNSYPGDNLEMTLDELREDNVLLLIPEQVARPDAWLKRNYKAMFESELESWYTDEAYWPKDRSYKVFKNFFNVHFCSEVVDMARRILREMN